MAGYVVTRAAWDAVLQEDYVTDGLREAVNTATPFFDELERKATTHGRERVSLLQIGLAQGNGARAEGGTMPDAGAGDYRNVICGTKYNYASVKITGPAEASLNTAAAFMDGATRLIKDAKTGFKLNLARQSWGDGQGILALINGALLAGVGTAVADSAYGVLWGSTATVTTKLIKRNMVVQFGTEDNNGNGYTVQNVTPLGFTFLPVLVNAVADNATITLKASANQEIEGFLKMAATAAFQTTLGLSTLYHGLDRTLIPEWEGNVLNVGAALTLDAIRALRDAIWNRTDDEESNLFMCSSEFAREFEKLLVPGVRFVPTEFKGGRTLLSHDGLRISKDSRAPTKAFFLADTKTIPWIAMGPAAWLNDGSGIMRAVAGQDAKEGLYKWYANFDPEQPRRLGIGFNVTMA